MSADDLRKQIENLELENRSLKNRLAASDQETDELRRQVRELKINPIKRSYVDAEDEKESTAWKEKAHNLLSLLDQLQRDMQNDLRELENDTFSPSASRISTAAGNRYDSPAARESTRRDDPESPFSASNVTPIRTEDDRRSKRSERSDRGERSSRRAEKAEQQAAPSQSAAPASAPAPVAAAPAVAENTTRDAGLEALTQGYKSIGDSAKTLHNIYREIKRVSDETDLKDVWTTASPPIKSAAKTARKVSQTGGDRGHPDFVSGGEELIGFEREWVEVGRSVLKQLKSKDKFQRELDGLESATREFEDSFRALQGQDTPAVMKRHGTAAANLAKAMNTTIEMEAKCFGAA